MTDKPTSKMNFEDVLDYLSDNHAFYSLEDGTIYQPADGQDLLTVREQHDTPTSNNEYCWVMRHWYPTN